MIAVSVRASPAAQQLNRDLIVGLIAASRVLVAVAAGSLSDLGEDITLPQYRALVVLASQGPQRAVDLAAALSVAPSTGSRMIERLVRKQLVRRSRSREDRRTIQVHLTEVGRGVVEQVAVRRRDAIAAILEDIPADRCRVLGAALYAFADAVGEGPEPDWAIGWDA